MNKPLITALSVTFGRIEHLQRAIHCFLEQDYENKSLLILNTNPAQKLFGDFKDVKIINLSQRPPSLGACRNLAVREAAGDLLVTWDDDDYYLPNHLTNFAERFESGEWIWMENQFYSEQGRILKFMSGSYNTFAYTKTAWKSVGGFNELSVGEDKHFVSRVTSDLPGHRITLPPEKISFIYCWGNGAYHISGLGEDKRGMQSAYQRSADDLKRRTKNGQEKTGDITLKPTPVDTIQIMSEFLDRTTRKNAPKTVCIVELGRIGDIINILPVCKHIAEQHAKPHLMVSAAFASVLDGVSYVIPEVVDIPYENINAGMEAAQSKFGMVLRGQIWGNGHNQDKRAPAYNVESWRELGFLDKFDSKDFELVFDLRDSTREQQLVDKLKTDKPMLLVKLTGGMSSPFPAGAGILELVKTTFGADYNIIDLSVTQCERIYDLLGLMDAAAGLVTIDTSIAHLCAASTIPVLLIANPMPWAGTVPRCNCVERMTYTEAEKSPEGVCGAIVRLFISSKTVISNRPVSKPPSRRIWHAVERHEDEDMAVKFRKQTAQSTWDELYESGVIPCHYWRYERTALEIGDRRALPYLKDVLKMAMDQADPDDIIFWTNDDNHLHPDLIGVMQFCVSVYNAASSQRCEFRRKAPTGATPEQWIQAGERHMGRDLFAFKKSWLVRKWDEIPDFILGASMWDLAMACIIRLDKDIISTRRNIVSHIFPAEIPLGYVGHVWHQSTWSKPQNTKSPSELHNKKLFHTWASKNLPELKFTDDLNI